MFQLLLFFIGLGVGLYAFFFLKRRFVTLSPIKQKLLSSAIRYLLSLIKSKKYLLMTFAWHLVKKLVLKR